MGGRPVVEVALHDGVAGQGLARRRRPRPRSRGRRRPTPVCTLASRTALSRYSSSRAPVIGQVPTRVCQTRYSVGPSTRSVRWAPASARAVSSQVAQPSPSSASTISRARTSSDRLVSWVVSVVIDVGQVVTSCSAPGVELVGRDRQVVGVAAHLVGPGEAEPAVVGGVLDALGHDRPAGLLEAHPEVVGQGAAVELHLRAGRARAPAPRRRRAPRGRSGRAAPGPARPRRRRRPPARGRARGRARRRRGSGPWRRAAPRGRGARRPGRRRRGRGGPSRISRSTSAACTSSTTSRFASATTSSSETRSGAASAQQPVERLDPRRGREHLLHPQQRVVAGGAGAAPVVGQPLLALEDLLDHDPGVTGGVGQPLEVAGGVGQAVGVVDAEAVDLAVAVQRRAAGRGWP